MVKVLYMLPADSSQYQYLLRAKAYVMHLCKTYSKHNSLMESCGHSNVFTFCSVILALIVLPMLGSWDPGHLSRVAPTYQQKQTTNKKLECKSLVQ